MKPPRFITLEGIEGVGKSSCLKMIADWLSLKQKSHVLTREPGGTPIAEKIRSLILADDTDVMLPETELLLIFAARAQHIEMTIKPALEAGSWVICDRFTDSSYAYQGGGRGIDSSRIAFLEDWVQGALRPHLTFLLEAPFEVSVARVAARGVPDDRIGREAESFFTRVNAAYHACVARDPSRYRVIQTNKPLSEVQDEIIVALNALEDPSWSI